MDPIKQRVAIAEACGWKQLASPGAWVAPSGHFHYPPNGKPIPDYLNDLNAMHEVEKTLDTPNKRIRYAEELGRMWTGHKDRAIPDWWFIHEATAAQRAEAFLRTLNLWIED